jgi:hypothetical protein
MRCFPTENQNQKKTMNGQIALAPDLLLLLNKHLKSSSEIASELLCRFPPARLEVAGPHPARNSNIADVHEVAGVLTNLAQLLDAWRTKYRSAPLTAWEQEQRDHISSLLQSYYNNFGVPPDNSLCKSPS